MIHFYNNFLENISDYGLAIRNGAHAKIENCHFESVDVPIATDKFEGHGYACVSGSTYSGTCSEESNQINEPTGCDFWITAIPYAYTLESTATLALSVQQYAGVGKISKPSSDPVSVNRLEEPGYRVMVNRSLRSLEIEFHHADHQSLVLSLYSLNGQRLLTRSVENPAGLTTIMLPDIQPGIYLLHLQINGGQISITYKVIF